MLIVKNIYQCWENLGRKVISAEKLQEKLAFFPLTRSESEARISRGKDRRVWIWIPLKAVSKENGICGIRLESHLNVKGPVKPLAAVPGEIILLDERLERHWPVAGGGIVLMHYYKLGLEPSPSASGP